MMNNQSAKDLKNAMAISRTRYAGSASVELVLLDIIEEREIESAQWVDDMSLQAMVNRLEGRRARPAFFEFRSLR